LRGVGIGVGIGVRDGVGGGVGAGVVGFGVGAGAQHTSPAVVQVSLTRRLIGHITASATHMFGVVHDVTNAIRTASVRANARRDMLQFVTTDKISGSR
jgi:hypothetical protein